MDMSRLASEMFEEDFGGKNARLKIDVENPLLEEWPSQMKFLTERYAKSVYMVKVFGNEKKRAALASSSLLLSTVPTLYISFETKCSVLGIPLAIELVSGTYFLASYKHFKSRQKDYECSAEHHLRSAEELMKTEFSYPGFKGLLEDERPVAQRLVQSITKHPYCLP